MCNKTWSRKHEMGTNGILLTTTRALHKLAWRSYYLLSLFIPFPYLSLWLNKIRHAYVRANIRFELICAIESYERIRGVSVWKSLKNARVVSEIRWSIVIGRMKKRTELYLLRAASFGMVGASVDGKRSVVTDREENRPFQCEQQLLRSATFSGLVSKVS